MIALSDQPKLKGLNMLEIKNVDHLNMNVSNLSNSVAFYEKLFSLRVFEEGESSSGNPYKIIGLPGSLFLCLYENKQGLSKGSLNHIGINISGKFEEAEKALRANGIDLNYGGIVEYPHSRSLYISDPDGNEIELSEVFGGGLGLAN
jgi:catechol-2,3-dioxygenase